MAISISPILDRHGRNMSVSKPSPIKPIRKQAFGLLGSTYEYPWAGKYHARTYTNQDSETGINQHNRDVSQRLSREMAYQQPWIYSAIRLLTNFVVGNAYKVIYSGDDSKWGALATDWLHQIFYPNCCTRGPAYDFQTVMRLISGVVDVDGDILMLFGDQGYGPQIQLIPSHRIRSSGADPFGLKGKVKDGPIANTIVSDGVIYTRQGTPVGYSVIKLDNLVNSSFSSEKGENQVVLAANSDLIYFPQFPDRGRGIPTIASGIMQALSVEEIEMYLVEKMKLQSMYAVEEKVPESEGPYEEEQNFQNLMTNSGQAALQGFSNLVVSANNSNQGLRVVDRPGIRYTSCQGGAIKFPPNSISDDNSLAFVTRLEEHVLACLGVPHALLFSQEDISGKMNNNVANIFNASIVQHQQLLDKHGKLIVSWALNQAIKNGELPENDSEIYSDVFTFTHPDPFALDDNKTRQADLDALRGGTTTLDAIARRQNTTAQALIEQQKKETMMKIDAAKEIVASSGGAIDVKTALQCLGANVQIDKQKEPTKNAN